MIPLVVQASTKLVDWATLLARIAPSGVVEFVDSDSSQLLRRFYRAFTE